jgi:phosphoribosyl 1,2-cyclic phosphodiesterase
LDAGTGIRELGLKLERQGATEFDLLITHSHMDHLQGFPFFNPAYSERSRIGVYLTRLSPSSPLSEPFDKLMEAPHFPVPFGRLPSDIRFHEMNGSCQLGEVAVRSHPVNHPGGCIAYRLEYGGKTLVYLTDHEPYASDRDRPVRDFTRGASLLIREAQYTAEEYETRRGWGHSTFDVAADDAIEAGLKKLAIFHHDPQHDDRFLESELERLKARHGSSLDISLAREGQCIELA